jgi:hypothetical protein
MMSAAEHLPSRIDEMARSAATSDEEHAVSRAMLGPARVASGSRGW